MSAKRNCGEQPSPKQRKLTPKKGGKEAKLAKTSDKSGENNIPQAECSNVPPTPERGVAKNSNAKSKRRKSTTPVVGSAKSLINSIRTGSLRQDSDQEDADRDRADKQYQNETRNGSKQASQEGRYDENDGVKIGVSSSDDEYLNKEGSDLDPNEVDQDGLENNYPTSDSEMEYTNDVSEGGSEPENSNAKTEVDFKSPTKNTKTKYSLDRNDPEVQQILNQMIRDEKKCNKRSRKRNSSSSRSRSRSRQRERKTPRSNSRVSRSRCRRRDRYHKWQKRRRTYESSSSRSRSRSRSRKSRDRQRRSRSSRNRSSRNQGISQISETGARAMAREMIKSPSDTTVYVPALKLDVHRSPVVNKHINGKTTNNVNQISRFVEKLRLENRRDRASTSSCSRSPSYLMDEDDLPRNRPESWSRLKSVRRRGNTPSRRHRSGDESRTREEHRDKMSQARSLADKLVIDAEKFKASVAPPPKGNYEFNPDAQDFKDLLTILKSKCDDDGDDEFFHITCHLDLNTRQKIGRGEFVDLEKLLPRPRGQPAGEGETEIIRNGSTYLLPTLSSSGNKITNVRLWEQAFRVYAVVYSEANSHRAVEIWQYVHIINSAASTFTWENVSFYDTTFRQLMDAKPKRSWAKIYNQVWNLAMRDHIPRGEHISGLIAAHIITPTVGFRGSLAKGMVIGMIDVVGDSTKESAKNGTVSGTTAVQSWPVVHIHILQTNAQKGGGTIMIGLSTVW